MPEALKKVIEDIARPIGEIGTKASNEVKLIGDKFPDIKPKKPTPPVVLPPTRMPTEGDKAAAQRRSVMEQLRRRGRASTILTDTGASSDTLGG